MAEIIDIGPGAYHRKLARRLRAEGKPTAWLRFVDMGRPKILTPCHTCIHHYKKTTHCRAFPPGTGYRNLVGWGIPQEILSGKHDHRTAYPGDGGFRWTPKRRARIIPWRPRRPEDKDRPVGD